MSIGPHAHTHMHAHAHTLTLTLDRKSTYGYEARKLTELSYHKLVRLLLTLLERQTFKTTPKCVLKLAPRKSLARAVCALRRASGEKVVQFSIHVLDAIDFVMLAECQTSFTLVGPRSR